MNNYLLFIIWCLFPITTSSVLIPIMSMPIASNSLLHIADIADPIELLLRKSLKSNTNHINRRVAICRLWVCEQIAKSRRCTLRNGWCYVAWNRPIEAHPSTWYTTGLALSSGPVSCNKNSKNNSTVSQGCIKVHASIDPQQFTATTSDPIALPLAIPPRQVRSISTSRSSVRWRAVTS